MNQPIYQTPINRRSRAADFRRRARLALTNRWVLAIAVFLLVSVLGSVSVIPTLTVRVPVYDGGNDPTEILRTLYRALFSARMLIFYGFVSVFAFVYQIFVGAPVNVGYSRFTLDLLDGRQDTGVNALFSPFRTCYWRAVGVRTLLILIPNAIMLICGVICGVLLAIAGFFGYSQDFYTAGTVAGGFCFFWSCLRVLRFCWLAVQ